MANISAKTVKKLRDKTGAGMMDCKKALLETDGDLAKAVEWLRQKSMVSTGTRTSRAAVEGLVESYIHTGARIGVLVEINCETDFVARSEKFQKLAKNIAMQIAACSEVEFVRVEDIPREVVAKEKEIEMGREDLKGKPDNIRAKIVNKRLQEMSLLPQPYIRDRSVSVEELVKQHIALLGENIQIRRFVRFLLGEGIEKEEADFAAEVAAQTKQDR